MDKIETVVKYNIVSLLQRILSVPTPVQNLCSYFMAVFAAKYISISGRRVVKSNLSQSNGVYTPFPREVAKSMWYCGL